MINLDELKSNLITEIRTKIASVINEDGSITDKMDVYCRSKYKASSLAYCQDVTDKIDIIYVRLGNLCNNKDYGNIFGLIPYNKFVETHDINLIELQRIEPNYLMHTDTFSNLKITKMGIEKLDKMNSILLNANNNDLKSHKRNIPDYLEDYHNKKIVRLKKNTYEIYTDNFAYMFMPNYGNFDDTNEWNQISYNYNHGYHEISYNEARELYYNWIREDIKNKKVLTASNLSAIERCKKENEKYTEEIEKLNLILKQYGYYIN